MNDFEKIYSDYFDVVYQYALTLCHNEQWAEEITQEAFFKALKSVDTYPVSYTHLDVYKRQVSLLRICGKQSNRFPSDRGI